MTGSACSSANGTRIGLPSVVPAARPFSDHCEAQSPVSPRNAPPGAEPVPLPEPSYEKATSGASWTKPCTEAAAETGAPSAVAMAAPTSMRRLPSGSFAPSGPKVRSPVFAQETFTPSTSGSTSMAAGSTGTSPSALLSPSTELSSADLVMTSVPPLAASPTTSVTSASRPSGAPGAGALAITSPTATGAAGASAASDAEGAGEEGEEGEAGVALAGFAAMTARPLSLSYEATLSDDFCAQEPDRAASWVTTAVGADLPNGACTTASCSGVEVAAGVSAAAAGALSAAVGEEAEQPVASRAVTASDASRACLVSLCTRGGPRDRVDRITGRGTGVAHERLPLSSHA